MQNQEKKRTFTELIRLLSDAEESDAIDDQQYAAIIGDIADKVDALRHVETKLESEIERLKRLKLEFQHAQGVAERQLDRLKEYIKFTMSQNGYKALHGNEFSVKLYERTAIEIQRHEPDHDLYLRLNARYPGVIERKLEWRKNELKKVIDEHPDDEDLARIHQRVNQKQIRWGVKK